MRRADEADIVAAAVTSTAIGIVVVVFEVISRGARYQVIRPTRIAGASQQEPQPWQAPPSS